MLKQQLFFIGDIHGHRSKLDNLLSYANIPLDKHQHKIVFLGDFIDNNIELDVDHLAVLTRVKELVDSDQAYAVMGNHEFNAIGWTLQREDGSFCRSHKPGNQRQHASFLQQVGEGSELHHEWIAWFKSLPLFREFDEVRAIHACWHPESIQKIKPYLNDDNSLKEEHWYNAFDTSHELFQLFENLLKGPEMHLPQGYRFTDKNGIERSNIRVAWWKQAHEVQTYQDIAVVPTGEEDAIPDIDIDCYAGDFIYTERKPVVIGHYTLSPLSDDFPSALSPYVVCVDFSAAKDGSELVGYRMQGSHTTSSSDNFEYISKQR